MAAFSRPETWVSQYGDVLYKYALLRMRDPSLAEDLVQETFLAALKAHESFSGQSSEQTWLIGILKHKIVDHLRKSKRETPVEDIEASVNQYDEQFERQFDQHGHWRISLSDWKNPDESLHNQKFWETFTLCVSTLPSHLADLFILREIKGIPTEELCKVLEISTTNNMWVMLSRARARLRQCLETNWFTSNGYEK